VLLGYSGLLIGCGFLMVARVLGLVTNGFLEGSGCCFGVLGGC